MHRHVALRTLLSDHSSMHLLLPTEKMKLQRKNESTYLILASCVKILSKMPRETDNPANLSFVLVWYSLCGLIRTDQEDIIPLFQSSQPLSQTDVLRARRSTFRLTSFLNKQFTVYCTQCLAIFLWDIHFYMPEGKQQTMKKNLKNHCTWHYSDKICITLSREKWQWAVKFQM